MQRTNKEADMAKIPTIVKGFAVLAFMLLGLAIVSPDSTSAAAGNPSYCDSEVDLLNHQDFGTEVPVIMVHGRDGRASDWGSISDDSSFAGRVNDLPNVAVAHRFSYNTNNWVTHQNSGPKLAKTIDCVSRLSVEHGGQGKVIVVGYSMGGLVIREALSKRSSDNQRAIADEVGQAITIGTPHNGIIYPVPGRWGYNSAKLQALPKFPAQTIVHTIAGDVTRVQTDWRGNETRTRPYNDTLVSTFSAHSGWTIDSDVGGGFKDITCEKRYAWYGFSQTAPCEHGQLIAWANNGVREDTMDAIGKFVASLTPPQSDISLTVGTLTATFDERWENVSYGASGPGEDGSGQDTTNTAACTNCQDTPPPQIKAFVDLVNMSSWCTGPILDCAVDPANILGAAPAVTIGGRTPDFSARYLDSGYANSMVWCFEEEQVCVHYRRGTATPQLEPSQALLDLFSTASWSN
jgi:pimeloyl-ACP methyl ester carboxylesterase